MTIKIDLNRALVDVDYAKECYIRSQKGENIDNAQIKEIENKYSDSLKGWKAEATNAQNSYEITDLDDTNLTKEVNTAAKKEVQKASSGTKYKGKTREASKAAIGDAVMAGVGTVGSYVAQAVVKKACMKHLDTLVVNATNYDIVRKSSGEMVLKYADGPKAGQVCPDGRTAYGGLKHTEDRVFEAYEDGGNADQMREAGNKGAKETGESAGALIGCLMAFATGTKYWIQQPNKDETDELNDTIRPQLESGEVDLGDAEDNMEESNNNIDGLKTDSSNLQEDLDNLVKELQKQIEEKKARQEELKAKEEKEGLSDSEKAELQTLGTEIAALNEQIASNTQTTGDEVQENAEEIEGEQETMADAQEEVDTIQDVAEYAESYDTTTRTMCIVEAASQGLNAYNGTKSAAKAFKLAKTGGWAFGIGSTVGYVIGGMGLAGAAASTGGAIQQGTFIAKISKEISVRENVQQSAEKTQTNIEDNNENLEESVESVKQISQTVFKSDDNVTDTDKTVVPAAQDSNTADSDNKDDKKDELKDKVKVV